MAHLSPISPETEAVLSGFPSKGDAHLWLAKVAGRLSGVLDVNEVREILYWSRDHIRHRKIPDREIEDAIAFGFGEVKSTARKFSFPEPMPSLIGEVLGDTEPIANPANSTGLKPSDVLHGLYASHSIICIGKDEFTAEAYIYPDDTDGLDLSRYQYIVPNPLRALGAVNNAGQPSIRCQNNIESRRFVVVEFDKEPDKLNQAKLINFLSGIMPCLMVVDSAGKSLHGWFPVAGMVESQAAAFFGKATALGADPSIYDPAKWVRMPGGLRDGKKRQRIIYYDEGVLESDTVR